MNVVTKLMKLNRARSIVALCLSLICLSACGGNSHRSGTEPGAGPATKGSPPAEPDSGPGDEEPAAGPPRGPQVVSRSGDDSDPEGDEDSDEDEHSANPRAESLHLRVIPEGRLPHYPAQKFNTESVARMSEAYYGKSAIRLSHPLPVADPDHVDQLYYFTWSELAFQKPIVAAVYDHQVESSNDVRTGNPQRFLVSFEKGPGPGKPGRWFVPLMDLFPGPVPKFNPTDRHTLSLDLAFQDGHHLRFEVLFQIVQLPPIRRVGH